jgi:hypothetical protein
MPKLKRHPHDCKAKNKSSPEDRPVHHLRRRYADPEYLERRRRLLLWRISDPLSVMICEDIKRGILVRGRS